MKVSDNLIRFMSLMRFYYAFFSEKSNPVSISFKSQPLFSLIMLEKPQKVRLMEKQNLREDILTRPSSQTSSLNCSVNNVTHQKERVLRLLKTFLEPAH